MKKLSLILLAMLLALTSLTAFAEQETETPDTDAVEYVLLHGFVTDVQDGVLQLLTRDGLTVEAAITDETILEGQNIATGDFVEIAYNGIMTRSLPAKITAIVVRDHMLMGLVNELTETGFTLVFGEDTFQVNADAALLEGIQDGMFVYVFFNGIMSRSLPAQVSALHIRGQETIGTVTEMVEGGFTMTVAGEEIPYHVALKEDALLFTDIEPGMELIVISDGLATASSESILINATEVLGLPTAGELFDLAGVVTELGEGFILIETFDGQSIQVNTGDETYFEGKEIAVGDFVHITYNGQMTFSLPAQVFGLKIACYTHEGAVSEIIEGQFALDTENGIVLVHATEEQLAGLEVGQQVIVYTNGIMTASLPAQITAEWIAAVASTID